MSRDERDARDHVPAFGLAKQVLGTVGWNRGAGSTKALEGLPEDVVVIYGSHAAAVAADRRVIASVQATVTHMCHRHQPFVFDNHAVQVVLRATVDEAEGCISALRTERDAARKEATTLTACLGEARLAVDKLTRWLEQAVAERDAARKDATQTRAELADRCGDRQYLINVLEGAADALLRATLNVRHPPDDTNHTHDADSADSDGEP